MSPDNTAGQQGCPAWRPWLVWLPAALVFTYAFFHRVAPSVMIDPLMRDLGVGAAVLGNLSAFYFYAYAGLQIGPQYDRLLLAQHRAVSDAIQARDGEAAARAMADHLDTVLSSYAEDQDPEPNLSKDKLRVVSG